MENLDSDTKDELNPNGPLPTQELLDETSNDGAKNGAANGRKYDIRDGVLLSVGIPHVGNHTECDGASC